MTERSTYPDNSGNSNETERLGYYHNNNISDTSDGSNDSDSSGGPGRKNRPIENSVSVEATVDGHRSRPGRLRRRTVQVLSSIVTAAALATATAAVAAGGGGSTAESGAPSTRDQEAGMVAGEPFADPPDVAAASGEGLAIVLEANQARLEVAGRMLWGKAYNGSFIAPTLHLAPGRTATITLVNHLSVATNLHFHGLHVTPTTDGDNPNICVAPGESFVYRLKIPVDHPQGSFWYHSHAMAAACSPPEGGDDDHGHAMRGDTENQIFAGLSGALVVGDVRSTLPAAYRNVVAHTFLFKDVQFDGDGRIRQSTDDKKIDSNAPTVRLVNGQLRPVLDIRPGETQLWRLVNGGANIYYRLALDGFRFAVVGEDGRPVAAVTTPTSLSLPPAKRFEVMVTAPDLPSAATATLRTTAFDTGPTGDSYPDVALAEVRVAGAPATPLPLPPPPMSSAVHDLSSAPVAQRRTVVLSQDRQTEQFTINGRPFSMAESVFDTPAVLGTVEEWTILNASGADHPFHLHINAFQVMSEDGVPKPFTGWQDIAEVVRPPSFEAPPGQIVVRIDFSDFVGRWMFHCHIASHEDNGMMSFVNVVPATLPFTL